MKRLVWLLSLGMTLPIPILERLRLYRMAEWFGDKSLRMLWWTGLDNYPFR